MGSFKVKLTQSNEEPEPVYEPRPQKSYRYEPRLSSGGFVQWLKDRVEDLSEMPLIPRLMITGAIITSPLWIMFGLLEILTRR